MAVEEQILNAGEVRAAARHCGFPLVGIAPAARLDPAPLRTWIARGFGAGLAAVHKRVEERLDPGLVVKDAKSVLVLAIPYGSSPQPAASASVIARYARGRDYHYAHRDRMRALRHRLCEMDATLRSYACVDAGAVMEKAWAERAGLGFIGKNGLVISQEFGSWITLSVMVFNRAVDRYDRPTPRRCGTCDNCLFACPTGAFASPGVLDARRCLAYHTVENRDEIPQDLRPVLGHRVFGCDICQEACPFNQGALPSGDPRQAPRPISHLNAAELAALTPEEFAPLAAGTPMARIGYDGMRRNACLSLGAERAQAASALLARLAQDPAQIVRNAAVWALDRLR